MSIVMLTLTLNWHGTNITDYHGHDCKTNIILYRLSIDIKPCLWIKCSEIKAEKMTRIQRGKCNKMTVTIYLKGKCVALSKRALALYMC